MRISSLKISLLAGFFCFQATAGCLSNAGVIVPVMKLGFSCPSAGAKIYITDDGDQCELVPTADWICAVDAYQEAFGGPYRYTGYALNNPEEPDNPTAPSPPLQETPDKPATEYVAQFSADMKEYVKNINANVGNVAGRVDKTYNAVNKANSDTRAAMAANTERTSSEISTLQSSLNSAQASIKDNDDANFQTLYDQAERHNSVAVQGVSDIRQQANQIQSLYWHVDGVKGTVETMNNVLQQDMAEVKQASTATVNAVDANFSMLQGNLINLQNSIDNLDTGSGTGGLSPADSRKLSDISDGIEDTVDAVEDVEDAVSGMRSALSDDLYWTTGQLGEKLDAINATLQSGSGGGPSGGDTVTHEKLDGISDKLGNISDSLSGTASDGQSQGNGVNLPDYQKGVDEGYSKIMDKINSGSESEGKVSGITKELKAYESLPQFFAMAQRTCEPIQFGDQSLDLCQFSPTIRYVLTWVFYMLTALFMIRSFHQTIQNMRL